MSILDTFRLNSKLVTLPLALAAVLALSACSGKDMKATMLPVGSYDQAGNFVPLVKQPGVHTSETLVRKETATSTQTAAKTIPGGKVGTYETTTSADGKTVCKTKTGEKNVPSRTIPAGTSTNTVIVEERTLTAQKSDGGQVYGGLYYDGNFAQASGTGVFDQVGTAEDMLAGKSKVAHIIQGVAPIEPVLGLLGDALQGGAMVGSAAVIAQGMRDQEADRTNVQGGSASADASAAGGAGGSGGKVINNNNDTTQICNSPTFNNKNNQYNKVNNGIVKGRSHGFKAPGCN